jgi:mRNA deadenylase 3'-5' endonuclease subunit Ccr4
MQQAEKLFMLLSQTLHLTNTCTSILTDSSLLYDCTETHQQRIIATDQETSASSHSLTQQFAIRDSYFLSSSVHKVIGNAVDDTIHPPAHSSDSKVSNNYERTFDDNRTSFHLKSVFGERSKEPKLTNWNGSFKGTLDYIFVDSSACVQSSRVLPSVNVCDSNVDDVDNGSMVGKLLIDQTLSQSQPSSTWPSDHFAIISDILLT